MKQLLLIGLVLTCVYVERDKIKEFFRRREPSPVARDLNCGHVDRCFVAYLAPWCPACQSMKPDLIDLKSRFMKDKKTRLIYIMGAGRSPGENEREAKTLGEDVIIDDDGSLRKRLEVKQYPSFYLYDSKGILTSKNYEAFKEISEI